MTITEAVQSLIEQFVRRQVLVLTLMRKIRPDIVMYCRNEGSFEEYQALHKKFHRNSQLGVWDDWNYFIHGNGCRLTHRITGEPIEWDVADLRSFDTYWFLNYVEWQLAQRELSKEAQILADALAESGLEIKALILRELAMLSDQGVLSPPQGQIHYTELAIDESSLLGN